MGGKQVMTGRRRRADAERSIEAIVDSATRNILASAEVNMTVIARSAGVSRVTLYAHFPTREALLEAVLGLVMARVTLELSPAFADAGPVPPIIERLLRTSWPLLHQHRNLFVAAAALLPPARMRALHQPVFGLVENLIRRGRRERTVRRDLPEEWLVSATYALLHLAAEEQAAGHLAASSAGDAVTATIMSVLCA